MSVLTRALPVLAIATVALAPRPAAHGLQVDGAVWRVGADGPLVELDVSWRNAWRSERNHDAAWVVLRDGCELGGAPLTLDRERAAFQVVLGDSPAAPGAVIDMSDDAVGCFVRLAEPYRGDVRWRIAVPVVESPEGRGCVEVAPFALEMVFVPGGPFELGDDDPGAIGQGAFHRLGDDGEAAGTWLVEDERAIPVGGAGGLAYDDRGKPDYVGDGEGPIPAAYPKGTRAFYVMKYELKQGEYAAFLNALGAPAWKLRANHELGEGREVQREVKTCTIRRAPDGGFVAEAPERPANFVSWNDTAAFADWAGLRPMSELEFEKAARGPARPTPLDFPWGTASRDELKRRVEKTRDLAFATAEDERGLDDATRAEHGASFYWVMDLSGSLWERVVTAGNPVGRAFTGSHGDGVLDPRTGAATNADWPLGEERLVPGVGYRGGAEYFTEPTLTNPESRVAIRTYGAWGGAHRFKTYSARACRTAPDVR